MSTFSELIEFVQIELNDPAILKSTIKSRINSVVQKVAGGVYDTKTGGLTPPLPELYKIGTVDADSREAYISLPDDYQRNLCFCANSTEELKVYDSFTKFIQRYPLLDNSGSVHSVCVKANDLYYQDKPSTYETLTIHYYRVPDTLVNDNDVPEGIVSHFQRDLIVPMTCELIVDSESPRKKYFIDEATKTIAEFREFLGPEDKEAQNIDDSTEYI